MKKILRLCITVGLVTALAGTSFAAPTIRVYIDGAEMSGSAEATIIQSRTMVPFRAVFEGLGAQQIFWDPQTKTVTGTKDETTVTLAIGNKVAFVNGEAQSLEVGPAIVGSSTLVPLSFISQKMGYKVGWQASSKTVFIMSPSYYEQVKGSLDAKVLGEENIANQSPVPSSEPVNPIEPADPIEPINPVEPVNPIEPSKPVEPSKPDKPVKPIQPDKTTQGNVSAGVIRGAFAMQNMKKSKFVFDFRSDGTFHVAPLGSKDIVSGTYKIKGSSIELKSSILNGSFAIEEIKGKRTYYLLKSTNGGAFAMTSITREQFNEATGK
ncbi:MAG: stalk domain-containing protein [Filifactor alocis]|nr:stalk domain-containing protein [Filifactor alocis]